MAAGDTRRKAWWSRYAIRVDASRPKTIQKVESIKIYTEKDYSIKSSKNLCKILININYVC